MKLFLSLMLCVYLCIFVKEHLIKTSWLQIVLRELQTNLKDLVLDKVSTLTTPFISCC